MDVSTPSVPSELSGASSEALQGYACDFTRVIVKLLSRELCVPEERALQALERVLALPVMGSQPRLLTDGSPALPAQFCWKLMFGHDCRHKACSAENRRCGMCLFNPKKRCTRGCNLAVKQLEAERLEAPCLAQVKVALFTPPKCDADSSPPSWPPVPATADLSQVFVEFSLLNNDLYESHCQGLEADTALGAAQLQECEILTPNKPEHSQLLKHGSGMGAQMNGHRVRAYFAPGKSTVIADLSIEENSNFRVGADVRYRLLARAIDTSTGHVLAQAVSDSFHVTTKRVQNNRKLVWPCLGDSVEGLEGCGTKVCEKLADTHEYAAKLGVSVPDNVNIRQNVTTVEEFRELKETIRAWSQCPRTLKNGLLPEAAVEHAEKVLGVDDRMRIWQDADSPYGLMYTCQQAQIQWNSGNPIVLLQFSSAQGLVRLTLAEDLSGKQHRLMADLAKKAAARWEGEQHPGWTPAGVDSEPLLADLQRIWGGSIVLTIHQYAELLRVVSPQLATPMVYQQPHAATPPSPFSQDQYQTSSHCIDSYAQQPQQLTGQSPVRQQVQAHWSQGPNQHLPSQIPMFSQHEDFNDATPAASANSNVHDSWDGSPSSDSVLNTQAMRSPQQDPIGMGSKPMLTSGTISLQQLGEGDMPPPGPRLPPAAPQQVDSFSFGQHAFGQPLLEPASSFGQFEVHAGYPQDFVPLSTTVGQQFPDGSVSSASVNLSEIDRSSHSSHDGSSQGYQWPGQSSTELPFSTGQFFQGSGEIPQSTQEAPSSTGQSAQWFGLVPQQAAGAFEAGAIPGRPVYGHSQSYSRVPSRRIVRGPSFTQRETKRRNTAPAEHFEEVVNKWSPEDFEPQANDVTDHSQGVGQEQQQLHLQQQQQQQDRSVSQDVSALQAYSLSPLAVAQGSPWPGPQGGSAQFPMQYPIPFSLTIPESLQLPASAYLDHPEKFQWIGDEISQLTSDDLRNCLAEAVIPPLPETNTEAEGNSDDEITVIQPQVQHVVFTFLTKMRALVARRRMQRGEMVSLSSQLDQRLRLRACVSTFQIAKRESCFTSCQINFQRVPVMLSSDPLQDAHLNEPA
ncbi:TPA: PSII 6.1 kDa protein, variant 3 [Trebouxia sp. C0004]